MRYGSAATRYLALVGLVLSVAFLSGCEETLITAPPGSVITVTPTPSTITINQVDGEEEGQAFISAQLTDSGQPVDDVPLFFSATGGLLGSVDNVCGSSGFCTRSGGACSVDGDCPLLAPATLTTNANGIATDVLTLRLFEDPDSVTVTVIGTGIEGSTTVSKAVNLGPADPVPSISAIPPGGQRTGLNFIFDGSGSLFDPLQDPTCYDWRIISNQPIFDPFVSGCEICADPGGALCVSECTTRAVDRSTVDFTIGEENEFGIEPTLSVFLKVSGQQGVVCNDSTTPAAGIFGPNIDTLTYEIDCDLTDPFVEAGPDRNASLSASGGEVSVTLTATASDPEDNVLDYIWDCGNGQGGDSQSVVCTYDSEGVFQATVIVENDCLLVSQDSLIVDIDP
jgi:hypothetical protein